jgi:NAD(P)H-dependent FMN reductase
MPQKIQVIAGSVRPTRLCLQIAGWVVAQAPADLALELVDLADWPLPLDAEPGVPQRDGYTQALTQAWSRKIAEADGYVFVTPQYNWGYPAALKNALDHLYAEWTRKPAVIVSYGFHGGDKCAAQLRQVLQGLRMRPAPTMPALSLPEGLKAVGASLGDPALLFADAAPSVRQAFAELAALLAETPA